MLPAIFSPLRADASTASQFVAGVHQKTRKSPLAPNTPRCAILLANQAVGEPATARPVIAVISSACQSWAGDHQKTYRCPLAACPAKCSTRLGPSGVT